MILRICVMGTMPAQGMPGAVGLGEGADDEIAGALARAETAGDPPAGAGFSRKAIMSCFVMRPPIPVPGTCDRFTLCSRAILRTSGEERACSSSSSRAGSAAGEFATEGEDGALLGGVAGETGTDAEAFEGAGAGAALSPSPGNRSYHRIHLYGVALDYLDVLQNAGGGRGDFSIDLVG